MRGGFRTRSDGQFVARSPKAAQNEIPKQDITDTADSKGATAGQSSSAIPSISLPKGGGAIRGIGEKFAANPVTGTGSLNVPIFTTPGRSGFGPQLSLSYDSGSGNGVFGFGWSLSLPSITRKTDKGLPRYQDADESDVFILSGAEDLVPVLVNQNGEWQQEQLPDRTLPDGSTFTIHQYRPRIEGLFARIERWTNKKKGDIHWRSISKDNITTIYGKNANSRITDPADESRTRIFSWLICESYDDKGNAIYYYYKAENSESVDLSLVNERNRDLIRSTNRYLKRIKYGNKIPHLPDEDLSQRDDWMFEVVFDYGEHYTEDDQGQPVSVSINDNLHQWGVRQDAFSSYRAGFDVRTYRLCQRVLMFHHFPEELGTDDYLVRSTEFAYDESTLASFITNVTQSGYVRRTDGTYLKKSLPPLEFEYSQAAIQDEIKEIDAESLENLPIGLDGSLYQWVDLDGEGLSGILTDQADAWFYKPNQGGGEFGPLQVLAEKPSSADLSSGRQQLMDLAGDGQLDLVDLRGQVPGFYERTQDQHWKQFTPFVSLPNIDWNDPNLKFVDLTGDGHADILITEDQAFTWYLSLAEAGFSQGEKVRQALDENTGPRLVFADGTQSIYLADLSGDGLTDLVRIRNGEVCYWPNLGYGRFGAKVTMDNSPWFDYPDQFNQQRIRLADIDGSGTTDIIYLRHDGVHLYFNRSGNSWSEARTLRQFPHIDNLSAVMVLDLKGNGTACIVWSSPLPGDAGHQMQYVDLMGEQKPHLLVAVKNNMGAETRVHYAPSTRFYLKDLKEGKPWITRIPFPVHVVERVETYDRISRNRFVTSYAYHHGYFDGIEREFRGFGMVEQWDTEEFGYEEDGNSKLKCVNLQNDNLPAGVNINRASHVPPVQTKTWFHTGAYLNGEQISRQFEQEYYREGDTSLEEPGLNEAQLEAMLLRDTELPDTLLRQDGTRISWPLSPDEEREGCRALKGSILRQEIYAFDGTEEEDRPYSVSERNYTLEMLQPQDRNRHAVFFTHASETIDFHYERKLYNVEVAGKTQKLADPRVTHSMNLDVDPYGNVLQSVTIGYGRRRPDQTLSLTDQANQTNIFITCTENIYTKPVLEDDAYRTPLPCETKTFELVNVTPDAHEPQVTNLFTFQEMQTKVQDAGDGLHDLLYEDIDCSGVIDDNPHRRIIEHIRTVYRKNDLNGLLPPREMDSMALPGETYKLAFTPGLLNVYQRKRSGQDTDNLLPDPTDVLDSRAEDGGGYVDLDGNGHWWIPSGQVFYWRNTVYDPVQELDFASKHFFLPHRFCDPFGHNTIVLYDSDETDPAKNYNLLLTETHDELGNTVTAENDYRVLQPKLITDPNGNRSAAAFDVLGMVVGTAVMGKVQEPDGKSKGDSLDEFKADIYLSDIQAFVADPRGKAPVLLKDATTRIMYDVDRYLRCGQPPFAATLTREIHSKDPGGNRSPVQISMTYSDGFGREVQTKIQAEPGDAPQREPDEILPGGDIKPGKLVFENEELKQARTDHRWVGKGRTVYNNKGKPVKQYEPFFSSTHLYEEEPEMTDTGVTPVLFYDPMERVVVTLHSNNTYEKVVFDPWHQKTYDVNDTVAFDPRTDTDVSGYVGEYFEQIALEPDKWETWLQQRGIDPQNPPEDKGLDPDKKAAVRTLVHTDTPTIAFFDSLGRMFLTVAHNKYERRTSGNIAIKDEKHRTRVVFDIEGNQREVRDERKDDMGNPQERIVMQYGYDMLGNRIHQASMEAGERWMLNNVAGNPIRTWDSRGFQRCMTYDALQRPVGLFVTDTSGTEFLAEKTEYGESKPDPETTNHRLKPWKVYDGGGVLVSDSYDFKGNPVISNRQLLLDYKTQVDWTHNPQLENETFISRTLYDALNRPIQIIAPHSSRAGTKINVTQPVYNEANLLERVDVWLEQDAEPDGLLVPDTASHHAVGNIDYNEKGQREFIEYGNGVRTQYKYDPQTFRLTHLFTTRGTSFPTDCSNPLPCADPPYDCPKSGSFTCGLQNIHYTYDPVGNITAIRDDAQQTIFFNGQVVRPDSEYKYDAIYRLIEAKGREHIGQASIPHTTWNDRGRVNLAHPNDGKAMRNYFEFYEYDEVGNILRFDHKAHNGNWIRDYEYDEDSLIELGKKSNRLSQTFVHPNSQQPIQEPYIHDPHGNIEWMLNMEKHQNQNEPNMHWDFKDQLEIVDLKGGGIAYYIYDATGQRVRKLVEKNKGALIEERIYLGSFEIFRRSNGSGIATLERETLHIMDDKQSIALVETRTHGNDGSPTQLVRYQYGNHLGSVILELDENAHIISYEEYYPYGSTSYQAVRKDIEVPLKRYRYMGKERDEETGLYYYGARYYVPWLGRWLSCDPNGFADGLALYVYCRNSPLKLIDNSGASAGAPTLNPIDVIQAEVREAAFELGKERELKRGLKELLPSSQKKINNIAREQGTDVMVKLTENLAKSSKNNRYPGVSRRLVPEISIKDQTIQAAGEKPRPGGRQPDLGLTKTELPGQDPKKEWASLAGEKTDVLEKQAYDVKMGGGYVRDKPGFTSKTGLNVKEVRPSTKMTLTLPPDKAASKAMSGTSDLVKIGETALETAAKNPGKLKKLVTGVGEVLAKKGGKVIPFVGIGVGVGLAGYEASQGNIAAAFVEAAGASEIPIVAQVADVGSLAADIGWVAKDVLDPEQKIEQWWYETFLK